MDKQAKRILLFIAFGVCLFVGLNHVSEIWSFLVMIWGLFIPVIAGSILAFFLNVPMKGFEHGINFITKKRKKPLPENVVQILSLLLTLISIILVIALVCVLVIPEIVSSVVSIYHLAELKIPEWVEVLKTYNIDMTWLSDMLSKLDFGLVASSLTSSATNLLNMVIKTATSTVSVFSTSLLAIIIALYILIDKKNLARQSKKIIYAYMKTNVADKISQIAAFINKTFSKFLSGQCMESLILGILLFITFSIFRLPYASLIAVLAAVFSLIPYIGAFAACLIGTLLTLMVDPVKALICVVVYLVVQFVESQFIYPHVVGGSVGLAPIWTLIAALLGGSLFGIVGMIFFIPLTAVIITLLKGYINERLEKKNIKIE